MLPLRKFREVEPESSDRQSEILAFVLNFLIAMMRIELMRIPCKGTMLPLHHTAKNLSALFVRERIY